MTFTVSNLIKDVLKAHQIERYQAFVLSWRFQGVPPPLTRSGEDSTNTSFLSLSKLRLQCSVQGCDDV